MFNFKKSILAIVLAGTILANSNINAWPTWSELKTKAKSLFAKAEGEIKALEEAPVSVMQSPSDAAEIEKQETAKALKQAQKLKYRAIFFGGAGFLGAKFLKCGWVASTIIGVSAGFIGYKYKNKQIKETIKKWCKKAKDKASKWLKKNPEATEMVKVKMEEAGVLMAKPGEAEHSKLTPRSDAGKKVLPKRHQD